MSAVGYHDLMEDPEAIPGDGPMLRRLRSERSEMTGFGNFSPSSSIIVVKPKIQAKENNSILSITECMVPVETVRRVGKASSVINGAELRDDRPRPLPRKGKASSVVSYSAKPESLKAINVDVKQLAKMYDEAVDNDDSSQANVNKGNTAWSDSEVGPSPSEVAAAVMAERRYPLQDDDKESSVLDGWSMDESVEGLRSKLERWRMELPPLYDNAAAGDFSPSSYMSSTRSKADKPKDGKFSCFGNIFGIECHCVCGKPPGDKKRQLTSPESSPDKSSIF